MDTQKYKNIDEYIATAAPEVQTILKKFRKVIRKAAPEAQEVISYGMPAFKLNGILVYFAAFKNHIGFFPTASGVAAFKEDVKGYATSKGTIRFPLDQPVPFGLVKEIVKFRVKENLNKIKQ